VHLKKTCLESETVQKVLIKGKFVLCHVFFFPRTEQGPSLAAEKLAEHLFISRLVSGHDFSRAADATKQTQGFSP
jgi:hypothetical protein